MSRLALGPDAPNRCDFGSRGRGEPVDSPRAGAAIEPARPATARAGTSGAAVEVQAALSPEASATTNTREPRRP